MQKLAIHHDRHKVDPWIIQYNEYVDMVENELPLKARLKRNAEIFAAIWDYDADKLYKFAVYTYWEKQTAAGMKRLKPKPPYGFRWNEDYSGLVQIPEEMKKIHRIKQYASMGFCTRYRMSQLFGISPHTVKRIIDRDYSSLKRRFKHKGLLDDARVSEGSGGGTTTTASTSF